MATLQHIPQHRDGIRTRFGTGILALSVLIAITLALLILEPTGQRTAAPTNVGTATQAVIAAQTPSAGCFRDPGTHALTCYAGPAAVLTPAPGGYFRDPITHKLLRITAAR